MNGLTLWECLAFTVLGGVGGFLVAHLVNPWLRGEEPWLTDEDILEGPLEDPLEGSGSVRRFRLVVDDNAGRTVYDWAEDADPKD
jgi:hypothetical protein